MKRQWHRPTVTRFAPSSWWVRVILGLLMALARRHQHEMDGMEVAGLIARRK